MEDYIIKLCDDLCDVINGSQLPISAKYYVIKDIFNEVQVAFNGYRTEVTKIMQEEQEKKETKEVTVPIEYTEEEIEAMKKKQ